MDRIIIAVISLFVGSLIGIWFTTNELKVESITFIFPNESHYRFFNLGITPESCDLIDGECFVRYDKLRDIIKSTKLIEDFK